MSPNPKPAFLLPPSGHFHLFPVLAMHKPLLTTRLWLVLLFGLAEVVAEVEVAGWFGDRRCRVWDRDVFQVQEAELDFHREENL